ncbi:MAG TPA: bifunctional hydroxymethylpyrimidine kinase/phosphomethylpyrimidine kinase [Anaeromyxobacteraceae bacterium]|nr:bifunctional hydroxymethylpyrimidine kinase/phosphomethylpyrimidine kinase [Anaeromyxobacteraceae bacterium]
MADLEAARAAGAEPYLVAAALTAQGPRGARRYAPAAGDFLLDEIDALLDGAEEAALPRAVKTGMLATGELAVTLALRLARRPLDEIPLVVDPVLGATSGGPLFDPGPMSVGAALEPLLRRARLVTPNLPELAAMTGLDVSTDEGAVRAARELPAEAVLVKGGHRDGPPVDLLVEPGSVIRFEGKRRAGTARGTGCRLASAIAARLAVGEPLEAAVRAAKRLVERYLDAAARPSSP